MKTVYKKTNIVIKKRGISLLELLIYIAILAGLMAIISDAFISLSKARGQAEARSEVNAAIRFATEKIRQDVKGASAVATPILGTASSTLNITVGGTSVVYSVSGGQLFRTASASSLPITGHGIVVGAPTFTSPPDPTINTSLMTRLSPTLAAKRSTFNF